ncbi:MbcA/ParS/Xre antitoxin family protein [Variovorax sp. KK3]|uniref:antitoxin Xre/MbcA/ParS toxin-binding domain-containing protein n=1 Tax=Variovorax sp. KK3 TaxID=1855728 RepID=UPI00097C9947
MAWVCVAARAKTCASRFAPPCAAKRAVACTAPVRWKRGKDAEESGHITPTTWIASWLKAPRPDLGGRRPEDYLDTDKGRTLLFDLLGRMQSGAFVCPAVVCGDLFSKS